MKKIVLMASILLLGSKMSHAQKAIEVSNTTDRPRKEVISIPFDQFKTQFSVDTIFSVKDKASGKLVVHQLERLGTDAPVNVLLLSEVPAKGRTEYVVSKEQQTKADSKTYGRYVPERFDDFAWENDKVAFRVYGKALEGRNDDAQGVDYWSKRTDKLIVNDWYKNEDYHTDHGEGLDYYTVGQTLGAGDLGIFINDSLQYTKHYRTHEILDNGPIRTTFRLGFEEQDFQGERISLTKTITLDAGQHFNRIVVSLKNENKSTTPIVVGVVHRKEEKPSFTFDSKRKFLAYWEPNINENGHTAVAVLLPNTNSKLLPNAQDQFLIETTIRNRRPFVYYNGAAWSKEGSFKSAEEWAAAVRNFSQNVQTPLQVKIVN